MIVINPDKFASHDRRRKVLVVDDDAILREVMNEQLGSLGWEVAAAENGEEAISLLANELPGLAIIDITMPGLDGFGLLGHMRQNPRTLDIPVIVCTSHNEPLPVERAYRLGASSFVTKPINWPQFLHHAQFVMRNGEIERALRVAETAALEASRVKSAMFQMLSHELKTPLTAMIGLTDVMERALKARKEPDVPQELGQVVEASRRLNAVISDIMLLSKAVSGQERSRFAPSSMSEILDDGLAGLRGRAASRRVRLLIRPAERDVLIMCDERLLKQALAKLADNAVRFSPEGGTVELWGHVRSNGSVLLSVRDHGPGLSQQKLRECLKPFMQEAMGYSRPAEGLGLGLPIAKAVCEAHGGELAIQTAPGQGLLAAMVLPAALHVREAEARCA